MFTFATSSFSRHCKPLLQAPVGSLSKMEEWKLDRKNITAGSFKWHADEYYARSSNKPKHMYSPDWLEIETKKHQEKARGGTVTLKVNPLEGPPSPKPQYGFFDSTMQSDGTLRPQSPTAMELGWNNLSGTQPLANTLNKRRPNTALGTMGRSFELQDTSPTSSPKGGRPSTSVPGDRMPRNLSLPEFSRGGILSPTTSPKGSSKLSIPSPKSPFSRRGEELMPSITRAISQPLHETAYAQPSGRRARR